MMELLRAISGLIGWALAFSTLYAVQGLSCALGWDETRLVGIGASRIILIGIYTAWVLLLAWLCWHFRPQRRSNELMAWLAFACAIVGLVSTIYTGLPVLIATACN